MPRAILCFVFLTCLECRLTNEEGFSILLHTPVLNKTPRLSSARMFVRLYRLLLIHCIYVLVTKPTCPAFSAIRSLKVTGKASMLCSMALPSKLCAASHGQSNVGSMCDCKPCGSLDLSVLVGILSGVDSDHGSGPRRNSRPKLADQSLSFKLSSG